MLFDNEEINFFKSFTSIDLSSKKFSTIKIDFDNKARRGDSVALEKFKLGNLLFCCGGWISVLFSVLPPPSVMNDIS